MTIPTLKSLIKDQRVTFDFYRDQTFYYICTDGENKYRFSVPLNDIGSGCLMNNDKAVMFMRYIRKSIESNELQKL